MTDATGTVRPSQPVAELRERMRARELTTVPVTTPDGRLVGVLQLNDT